MLKKLKITLFQVDQVIDSEPKTEGILPPILHLNVLMFLLFLNKENRTHVPIFSPLKPIILIAG